MSFQHNTTISSNIIDPTHVLKRSKNDKFKICKKEIDIYNCCIREISTEDPVHKCDDYMTDIQACLRKIEYEL